MDVKTTMYQHECHDCGLEFITEAVEASCPKCGYACIASSSEIVDSGANGEASEEKEDLAAVREVLQRLCVSTYDAAYQGSEWERLIDEALEEITPLIKKEI